MTTYGLTGLRAAALLLLAALSQQVHAQGSSPGRAALVLEVDGATTPALKPYREMLAGTTVRLGPSSRLVFLHYDTCRTFTVTGGAVAFAPGALPAIQGEVAQSSVRGHCPRTIPGSGSATIVFRERASSPAGLPATPSFVLVGQRADEFVRVRVLRQGEEVLAFPLDGPRFQWPAGTAALATGDYQLSFVSGRDGAPSLVVNFKVDAVASPPGDEGMTLITAD